MSDPIDAERIREEERRRIACDLHDELGSHLTALKMALAQLQQQLPTSAAIVDDATPLQAQVSYADQLVDGALEAMHNIIDDLHPAVLALGLPATLEWLTKSFARQTGLPHDLLVAPAAAKLQLDTFTTASLYRIAREALHNAARHAHARKMSIALLLEGTQLLLEISDDGIGLPQHAAADAQASGIRGMQTRAAAIGATLQLAANAGGGTRWQVSRPMTVLSAPKLIK